MVDINFDALLRIERFISGLDQRLQNQTRLWMDFVAPFTFGEIDDIFETEGYGQWSGLDPLYAARKAVTHPSQGILRRDDTYFEAATDPNHPGSIAEFGPTEMVLGVSGGISSLRRARIIRRCMKKGMTNRIYRRDRFMS